MRTGGFMINGSRQVFFRYVRNESGFWEFEDGGIDVELRSIVPVSIFTPPEVNHEQIEQLPTIHTGRMIDELNRALGEYHLHCRGITEKLSKTKYEARIEIRDAGKYATGVGRKK